VATFTELWTNHPGSAVRPCDASLVNQCAIRMSVALELSGVDTSSFEELYPGRRCWFGHSPAHILAAEEMANWMGACTGVFGIPYVYRSDRSGVNGKKGIVFIKDGWSQGGDHIDLWDRTTMKAGRASWLSKGSEIRFWRMG
jgi:hypothetical protein